MSAVLDWATICNWNEVGLASYSVSSSDQEDRSIGIRVYVPGGRAAIHKDLAIHTDEPGGGSLRGGIKQCEHY